MYSPSPPSLQMFVAMLREAIENDHVVFAFKSMILLKILVENGGRAAANRFVKASGMHVVVPLMVSLLAKVSEWKHCSILVVAVP